MEKESIQQKKSGGSRVSQENPFKNIISSEKELRNLVGFPSDLVKNKVINYLDSHCREFISHSPFLALSTADQFGFCDVSPRGDGPGFVLVIDDKHLIIPERPGNRRMDSLVNIVNNPMVGLLFMIPGMGETLRVNGSASVVHDTELLDRMKINGKRPILGIGIEVRECFIHCAKAIKRSGLWEVDSWPDKETLPSAAKILNDHVKLSDYSTERIEEILKEDYEEELY
jgi:uncharacterized protein